MELFDKLLIWSHVIAGGSALISGLVAAFFGKKGGKLHLLSGKVFFYSMTWIFISALLIVSFVQFNFFLLIIAVFSYYMTFSGYRVLKIKKTMEVAKVDWIASITTMVFGLAMLIYGVTLLIRFGSSSALGYLSLFFGIFTTQTGFVNFRGFRRLSQAPRMWWWFAHMNSMCGALIATITAFLVQNGRIFGLPAEMGWMLWVLPAIVGLPLVSYWARNYRKQFGLAATSKKQSASS